MHDSIKAEQVFSFMPQAGAHTSPQHKQLWEQISVPLTVPCIQSLRSTFAPRHMMHGCRS
jgi:hypothetical protein